MKFIIIIVISLIVVKCVDSNAKVIQLENEVDELKQEVLVLIDSIETIVNQKKLEIINLNATIKARENAVDSLMILLDKNLMDTTYLDTIRNRLLIILSQQKIK